MHMESKRGLETHVHKGCSIPSGLAGKAAVAAPSPPPYLERLEAWEGGEVRPVNDRDAHTQPSRAHTHTHTNLTPGWVSTYARAHKYHSTQRKSRKASARAVRPQARQTRQRGESLSTRESGMVKATTGALSLTFSGWADPRTDG